MEHGRLRLIGRPTEPIFVGSLRIGKLANWQSVVRRNDLEGWHGQYRRMIRWRDRVLMICGDRNDSESIFDFVYAFFQNSYHLGDWLIADEVVREAEVRDLFRSSPELKLCRDICNTTKHKEYSRGKPSADPSPLLGREWDPFGQDWHGWYLYSDKRRPIGELVNACVSRWDQFLRQKGLDGTDTVLASIHGSE